MKSVYYLFFVVALGVVISCAPESGTTQEEPAYETSGQQFYQLKTYTYSDDAQVVTIDAYLKDAFLPALKRLDIQNVGVFKVRPGQSDSIKQLFVLIPFKSLEEFEGLDGRLSSDQAYLTAGQTYLGAPHDQAPYERIESTLLKAFTDMPVMQPSPLTSDRSERIYELRSYESATENIHKNKVDMFNAGGEIKLFDRLGFNAVFYGSAVSGSKMPNLVYMTTFTDQTSRDAHWDAFVKSPEWQEMKALPKYQNNVSHIDIYFLYPTDYSDY